MRLKFWHGGSNILCIQEDDAVINSPETWLLLVCLCKQAVPLASLKRHAEPAQGKALLMNSLPSLLTSIASITAPAVQTRL